MKALVTGASRGLGRALCRRLASDGYEVWINYRSAQEEARSLLEEIESNGGKGKLLKFDVADEGEIDSVLSPLLVDQGPLDVLVNNAGVSTEGYMAMQSPADWDQLMSVNLGGFFRVTRACLKGMMSKRRGRVVNIGSLAGAKSAVGQVAYAASKAGLEGATRALAMEVARWNILVNAVAPGPLEVGMATGLDQDALKQMIPLGRVGKAEEVAAVVSFLCSDEASYITGQVIAVNGGMGM